MHILYFPHTDSQTAALNFGKATFRTLSKWNIKELSFLFYAWSWDSVVGVATRIEGSTIHSSIPSRLGQNPTCPIQTVKEVL